MRHRYHLISLTIIFALYIVSSCTSTPEVVEVQDPSMEPNLPLGSYVTIDVVDPSEIDRGDLIYFDFPPDPSRQLLKRVIGLPGETVEIENGRIFVDGELLEEPYQTTAPNYSGVWTMGTDEFFVLGDIRPLRSDSHTWGVVPSSNIIGIAIPR